MGWRGVAWRGVAWRGGIPQQFGKIFSEFRDISKKLLSSANYLTFPAIPAKFRKICGEKYLICLQIRKILEKSGKFNEKLQNDAKNSIGAVQRCHNLVDLEKG